MAKSGTKNFYESKGPLYRADYGNGSINADADEIRVVSWNIQLARKIPTAIAEIEKEIELAHAGILLLQEMDESGVDAIARALCFNYVYYPASIHFRTGRKFGNAVLSKWPFIACEKVSLPHISPRTGEIRIAAKARIDLGGADVVAYSVHTETPVLASGKRREQILALAEDIGNTDCPNLLVGGDFNTFRGKDVRLLEEVLGDVGLKRTSAGSGRTMKLGFLGFNLDHVFTRGLRVSGKGIIQKVRASDHSPVWLQLSMIDRSV